MIRASVSVSTPTAPAQARREPSQARSRERVQRILEATESLIETTPLDDITVAMISDRSGVKRATIYQFFTSVRVIFNTLGQRFLDELYSDFCLISPVSAARGWRETFDTIIDSVVDFYSHHPAACSLFLGDGSLHGLRVIDHDFDRRFSERVRELLGNGEEIQPSDGHDPIQIVVTLTISVLSLSVHIHGSITEPFKAQAKLAGGEYLSVNLDGRSLYAPATEQP